MAAQVLFHLALSTLFSVSAAWKCAKYEHYFSQQPDYIDCFWDCCGNSFNRHCCAPIGIIVGCCIIASVVIVGLVVLVSCWMHRRRAKYAKGPKRFQKRGHSHYPVAPSSVTRPAPNMTEKPSYGPPQGRGYGPPPPAGRGYGPPPDRGYEEYRSEKPRIDDFYNERPEMTSTMGRGNAPPYRGQGAPPNRGHPENRGPPSSRGPPRRDEMSSNDEYSDFEQRGPPRVGHRPAPMPSRQVKPPPKEFIEL